MLNNADFLKHFGKVRFFGLDWRRYNKDLPIGLIEFDEKDALVSEELVSRGYTEIEDKRLQLISYKDYKRRCGQVSAKVLGPLRIVKELLKPPDQDSPMNILNALNDDCLCEIFKKLHFSTLTSVAMVCTRFNRIAKEAFSSKYHSEWINIFDLDWNRQPRWSQIEDFLSEFGSEIRSLSTLKVLNEWFIKIAEHFFKLVHKYCKRLTRFQFHCFNINEKTLYESIFDIISDCSELEYLDMHFYSDVELILPTILYPKLVEVHFRWNHHLTYNLIREEIVRFLEQNPSINKLEIETDDETIINAVSRLEHLNEFKIYNIRSVPSLVEALSSHKMQNVEIKLGSDFGTQCIDVNSIDIIPKLENVTEIDINLHGIKKHSLIHLLQNLPNIKILQLFVNNFEDLNEISNDQIVLMATILQYANQLSKFTITSYEKETRLFCQYPIDEGKYDEILNLVQNRSTRIKLTIRYIIPTHKIRDRKLHKSKSILVLDMVPDLLIVILETHN